MGDEEREEQPRSERVDSAQHRQAAHGACRLGPARRAPHEQTAHNLQRQQNVQQRQIGELLQRIQPPLGRLLRGMGLTAEDPAGVVLHLG